MAKKDKLLENAKIHLEPTEVIEAVVQGTYETTILGSDSVRSGILIAAQNRVVFYAKKLTGYELESFSYKSITSFEQSKDWMGHKIKFHSSGNNVSMKYISDLKDMQSFVACVKSHLGVNVVNELDEQVEISVETKQQESANHAEIIDTIKQIGELHGSGILSDSEFESKKTELLAKLN